MHILHANERYVNDSTIKRINYIATNIVTTRKKTFKYTVYGEPNYTNFSKTFHTKLADFMDEMFRSNNEQKLSLNADTVQFMLNHFSDQALGYIRKQSEPMYDRKKNQADCEGNSDDDDNDNYH
jgi:hypothetical protein